MCLMKCCSHQGLGTLIASFGRDTGTREWKHALKTYCSARLLTLEPNSIMAGALAGAAFAGSEVASKFFGEHSRWFLYLQEPAPASMHGNARCLSFPLVGSGLQSIVTRFGCHTMDDLLEATTRPSKASQWLQIRLATATGHEQKVMMMLPTKNWEGSHWVLFEYFEEADPPSWQDCEVF